MKYSFGSKDCDKSLAKILDRVDEKKVDRFVGRRLSRFKRGINKIEEYCGHDKSFCINLLLMYKEISLKKLDGSKSGIIDEEYGADVVSHLRCCMCAEFSVMMRRITSVHRKTISQGDRHV